MNPFAYDMEFFSESELRSVLGSRAVVKTTPAVIQRQHVVTRYFGVPLRMSHLEVHGDLRENVKIDGKHVEIERWKMMRTVSYGVGSGSGRGFSPWKLPIAIHRLNNGYVLAPQKGGFGLAKAIRIIGSVLGALVAIPFVLFGIFLFWPLSVIGVAILVATFANAYLFFGKKTYLTVGPASVFQGVDMQKKTITIKGDFSAGMAGFIRRRINAEYYVGENIRMFS